MKTVFKYSISAEPKSQKILLPAGAQILDVGCQGEDFFAWAFVDSDLPCEEEHEILILPTGKPASEPAKNLWLEQTEQNWRYLTHLRFREPLGSYLELFVFTRAVMR